MTSPHSLELRRKRHERYRQHAEFRYKWTAEWRRRRLRLYRERGGRCEVCGKPLERGKGSWSCHSLSGRHEGERDENFVICCNSCHGHLYEYWFLRSFLKRRSSEERRLSARAEAD